jgi:hypothetical protein
MFQIGLPKSCDFNRSGAKKILLIEPGAVCDVASEIIIYCNQNFFKMTTIKDLSYSQHWNSFRIRMI